MEISAKDGSILRTLAEVPKEHTWNELRFNEGKVAPGGVFILGRMHYEGPMGGPPGRLYKCVQTCTNEQALLYGATNFGPHAPCGPHGKASWPPESVK